MPSIDESPSARELFREYAVEAKDVADFLTRFYKPSRYTEREDEYARDLLASYENDFQNHGWCLISRHDSRTGEFVSFYNDQFTS